MPRFAEVSGGGVPARACRRCSAAPLCQNLEILWRTAPSGANGPGRREIHRGKCFETNTYDAANSLLGIPGRGKCFETRRISELKETQKLISRHEHADAVRRLPSVRILEFFGGRLHREQMGQGATRSTVGNVFKRIISSAEIGAYRLGTPQGSGSKRPGQVPRSVTARLGQVLAPIRQSPRVSFQ